MNKYAMFGTDVQLDGTLVFDKTKFKPLCKFLEKLGYVEDDYSYEDNRYGIRPENVGFIEDVVFDVEVSPEPSDVNDYYISDVNDITFEGRLSSKRISIAKMLSSNQINDIVQQIHKTDLWNTEVDDPEQYDHQSVGDIVLK